MSAAWDVGKWAGLCFRWRGKLSERELDSVCLDSRKKHLTFDLGLLPLGILSEYSEMWTSFYAQSYLLDCTYVYLKFANGRKCF